MFRESLLYRRCAVPVHGFYEWNRAGEKAVFESGTGEELYFAGCYRMEEGNPRFVILTTQANETMKKVHDRMPLILKQEQLEGWLNEGGNYEILLGQIPEMLKKQWSMNSRHLIFYLKRGLEISSVCDIIGHMGT